MPAHDRVPGSPSGPAADPLSPSPVAPSSARLFLAGYELMGELGRGTSGTVYLARRGTAPLIALKVLAAREASDPEGRARFVREATVSSRIAHEGIVRVVDAGEAQGHHYIAMEFVAGLNLRERLAGQALPALEAARITGALARALEAAHAAGVVHRDLKPGNILIDRSGRPRIADFGLARDELTKDKLTRSGDILGTPMYMAPEQIAGKRIDRSIDVWALGVILWESLVGRVPFAGKSVAEIAQSIGAWRPVAPSSVAPYPVPPELDAICLAALLRDPRARPTAAEVAQALEDVAGSLATRFRTAAGPSRRRAAALATLAGAVGLLLGTALALVVEHRRLDTAVAKVTAESGAAREALTKRLEESQAQARRAAEESQRATEEGRRASDEAKRTAAELDETCEQLGEERVSWGDMTGPIVDHMIQALDSRSPATATRVRAALLVNRNRGDEALQCVHDAWAAHPDWKSDTELLRLEADAHLRSAYHLATTEATGTTVTRRHQDYLDSLSRLAAGDAKDARVVYAKAMLALAHERADPDTIFSELIRTHELDPTFAAGLLAAARLVLMGNGGVHLRDGPERALSAVHAAIETDPTAADAYYARSTAAWSALHTARDHGEAVPRRLQEECIHDLERAHALNGDLRHLIEVGKVAILFGHPRDAQLPLAYVLDRAARESMHWTSALTWRGNMEMALGDSRAAAGDWLSAAEADPGNSGEIRYLYGKLPAALRVELLEKAKRSRPLFESFSLPEQGEGR